MNISEATDVGLVLQHMIGATNAERATGNVVAAAYRLTLRAGKALQVSASAIATVEEIEIAVVELAQQQADAANYIMDYEDGYPDLVSRVVAP